MIEYIILIILGLTLWSCFVKIYILKNNPLNPGLSLFDTTLDVMLISLFDKMVRWVRYN